MSTVRVVLVEMLACMLPLAIALSTHHLLDAQRKELVALPHSFVSVTSLIRSSPTLVFSTGCNVTFVCSVLL